MNYKEDLEYTKNVYDVLQACLSGEILKSELVVSSDDENHWYREEHYARFECPNQGIHSLMTCTKSKGKALYYHNVINDGWITYENEASSLFYMQNNEELELPFSVQEPWDSEEQHFQNSLILNEHNNRMFLLIKYIKAHLPEDITYVRIQTENIDYALQVLEDIRNVVQ